MWTSVCLTHPSMDQISLLGAHVWLCLRSEKVQGSKDVCVRGRSLIIQQVKAMSGSIILHHISLTFFH